MTSAAVLAFLCYVDPSIEMTETIDLIIPHTAVMALEGDA